MRRIKTGIKRAVAILMALMLAMTMLVAMPTKAFAAGYPTDYWFDGHYAASYSVAPDDTNHILIITSAAEFARFAWELHDEGSDCYEGWTVTLVNDIDLSLYLWYPVDMYGVTLDGQGHQIARPIVFDADGGYAGLFGFVLHCTIKNLIIMEPIIDVEYNGGEYSELDCGVIAGYFAGSIREVYIYDPIVTVRGGALGVFIGGAVGGLSAYFESDYTMGKINGVEIHGGKIEFISDGFGGAYIGGIVGANYDSVIINAAAYGIYIATNSQNGAQVGLLCRGGITGYTSAEEYPEYCIFNCVSTTTFRNNKITATADYLGGICGWVNKDSVVNTIYIGDLDSFGLADDGDGDYLIAFNHKYATVAAAKAAGIVDTLNDDGVGGGFRAAIETLAAHLGTDYESAAARFKTWVYKTVLGTPDTPGFGSMNNEEPALPADPALPGDPVVPPTGDANMLAMMLAMSMLAVGAACVVMWRRRQQSA